MNAVWIVLPILTLLMFELGLTLEIKDFKLFRQRPYPVIAGLIGQIILLPVLAFALGCLFHLEPLFFIGLVLIACSPGGSSSNIFSMIAKGDVALSVSLTALSSIITLFTIPVIMEFATQVAGDNSGIIIHLPVGSLIIQNLLLMLLPIATGILTKRFCPEAAERIHKILSKVAFPRLDIIGLCLLHTTSRNDNCTDRTIRIVHHNDDFAGYGWRIYNLLANEIEQKRATHTYH